MFFKAVEAKQIAQQDAERAKFIVEKVSTHPGRLTNNCSEKYL
jgi:hypothetical protein